MRESRKGVYLKHAPDPGSCTAKLGGCSSKGPDFFVSDRDLLSMTDYRVT